MVFIKAGISLHDKLSSDYYSSPLELNYRRTFDDSVLTMDDYMICCGSGNLNVSSYQYREAAEGYKKDIMDKNYNIVILGGCDTDIGIYSGEYEEIEFFGGRALKRKECDNVYHLKRGEIYNIGGKTFFALSGQRDYVQACLRREDFESEYLLEEELNIRRGNRQNVIVNDYNWHDKILPSEEEKQYALDNLARHGNKVDYILTNVGPSRAVYLMAEEKRNTLNADLSAFFQTIAESVTFEEWFFSFPSYTEKSLPKYKILKGTTVPIRVV